MAKNSGRRATTQEMSGSASKKLQNLSSLSVRHLILIILLVSIGVYFNALFDGFVYDDSDLIVNNSWIKDMKHLPEIFSRDMWGFQVNHQPTNYYRPFVYVIDMFTFSLFGLKPWGFHLVNILFHGGSSVLVFLVISRLFRKKEPSTASSSLAASFIAAILFAAHPVHTETVTWCSGLPDLSYAFFSLLSFYLYTGSREGRKHSYLFSLMSFSVALLCKEPALTVPLFFIAYDYLFEKERAGYMKRYGPFMAVVAGYFLLRFYALGALAPQQQLEEFSAYQFVINIFPLFAQYLEKLVFPVNLNVYHLFIPIDSILDKRELISIAVTVFFIVIALTALKKNRMVFLGLFLTVVPLLPALYIRGISGGSFFGERYLYLPSFGFVILLGWMADWSRRRAGRAVGPGIIAAMAILAVLYCVGTVTRNTEWKDNYTLWSDAVEKSPNSALAHLNLGAALAFRGQIDREIEQYRLALELAPNYDEAHFNLGLAFFKKGYMDAAIEQFKTTLMLNPDSLDARYYLQLSLSAKSR